jgi:hypothetical protein
MGCECLEEGVEPLGLDREARGRPVPAEAVQVL